MSDSIVEYIGYVAMAFIGVSFLMKDIRKLRLLNLIGAGLFIFYGIFIKQPPIYLLNSFILLVNIYYLFQKKEIEK